MEGINHKINSKFFLITDRMELSSMEMGYAMKGADSQKGRSVVLS